MVAENHRKKAESKALQSQVGGIFFTGSHKPQHFSLSSRAFKTGQVILFGILIWSFISPVFMLKILDRLHSEQAQKITLKEKLFVYQSTYDGVYKESSFPLVEIDKEPSKQEINDKKEVSSKGQDGELAWLSTFSQLAKSHKPTLEIRNLKTDRSDEQLEVSFTLHNMVRNGPEVGSLWVFLTYRDQDHVLRYISIPKGIEPVPGSFIPTGSPPIHRYKIRNYSIVKLHSTLPSRGLHLEGIHVVCQNSQKRFTLVQQFDAGEVSSMGSRSSVGA